MVISEAWRADAGEGRLCTQGYLAADVEHTVRVRCIGDEGYLTIKGAAEGIVRAEYEYPIPVADACELLALCRYRVAKRRYLLMVGREEWVVDEFLGENAGLVLAEIELTSEWYSFERPEWVGSEVSSDPSYTNAHLARHPFKTWN